MTDRLVEIESKDLHKLKDLYTPDGSKSYIAYTTIDNYIRWFEQDPNLKHVKIFCLNGDFSDGTFVITDRCNAYADTFDEHSDKLTRLMQLLDYSKGYVFLNVRTELRSVIMNALHQANVDVISDMSLLRFHLPKEEAMKFDVILPQGIELKTVTELCDIEKVNSQWPRFDPNSLPFFQRIAKYNVNVGAYTEDGDMVAWLFRRPTGYLGALQTDDKHFGKGYAALVTKYVSKKIAELGHDIYAGIFEKNVPSQKLFKKLGYKENGQTHLIYTKITWSSADE